MELFHFKKDIPFMRYTTVFNIISALVFVASVFFLWYKGLNFSVEFTGGTVMEVTYEHPADIQAVRQTVLGMGFPEAQVQSFGRAQDVLIQIPPSKDLNAAQQSEQVMNALKAKDAQVKLNRVEFVGPQVGDELAKDGAYALLFVVIGMMIYLAFRFEWKYSVAAIIANLHDIVIILGFFAFFRWEFSLSVLAAVLAILGYSVNETVIVFDRVRETFRKQRGANREEIFNHAITSTISRTVMTHTSTQIVVLCMLFFGGPTLHYFAIALTIGICFGIYSSIFVSSSIAMFLRVRREDLIKPVKKDQGNPDGAVVLPVFIFERELCINTLKFLQTDKKLLSVRIKH